MTIATDIVKVQAAIDSILDNGQTIKSEDYFLQKAKLDTLQKRLDSLNSQNTSLRNRQYRIVPDRTN